MRCGRKLFHAFLNFFIHAFFLYAISTYILPNFPNFFIYAYDSGVENQDRGGDRNKDKMNEGNSDAVYRCPRSFETFEFSLTFDLGTPSDKIFATASSYAVEFSLRDLPLRFRKDDNFSRIKPDDFVKRISVQKRIPSDFGVEYHFSAYVDIKSLLFSLATSQKRMITDIKCGSLNPIVKDILYDYAVSATLYCNINDLKGEGISPNYFSVNLSGVVFSGEISLPVNMNLKLMYFSQIPYDEFASIFSQFLSRKFVRRVTKSLVNFIMPASRLTQFFQQVSDNACFFMVIPLGVLTEGENVKVNMLLFYFHVLEDESIKATIGSMIHRHGGVLKSQSFLYD